MIEVKTDPTVREVRVFGLLWLLFFCAVGAVVLWRPEALLGAAVFLGGAWLVSLVFNPDHRARQLLGVLMPLLFGLSGGATTLGMPPLRVAAILWAVAGTGAISIWASPAGGRRLYVGWMLAALPIGWTISHLVLGAVYYLVLTPIGLAMRLAGRDPMRRRFDRATSSYWIERGSEDEAKRHFRQF